LHPDLTGGLLDESMVAPPRCSLASNRSSSSGKKKNKPEPEIFIWPIQTDLGKIGSVALILLFWSLASWLHLQEAIQCARPRKDVFPA
jgi:hypothetical protein